MIAEVSIASRFRGPPTSGNGGYCSGLLSEYLDGDVVTRLSAPVPLDRELNITTKDDGLALCDPENDQILITARCLDLDLEAPPLPPLEEVKAASARYWRAPEDDFNGCFGCCQRRAPDDGIRVLAGPFTDDNKYEGMAADFWHAHPAFAGANGDLAPRYVWTAMDCSGGVAAMHFTDKKILTGAMHVRQQAPVAAGQDYVVLVWPIEQQGRKISTGSAIYDLDGKVLAIGKVLWITLLDH